MQSMKRQIDSLNPRFLVVFRHQARGGKWWLASEFVTKVTWDDDIPNMMESHKPAMFQSPTTRISCHIKSQYIPILIQYCSSYTPNKFFRYGPQEVNFFGIRSPRSPVLLRQSPPASRESEHFKRVIVQIESPNMAAMGQSPWCSNCSPKTLWRR